MADLFDNWTVQVRKGLLEMCVLHLLAQEERYAYDLAKALVGHSGLGITEGTIYPLLSRLRVQGLVATRLVESPEGPARKYYRLTAAGRKTLGMMHDYLTPILKSIGSLPQRKGKR